MSKNVPLQNLFEFSDGSPVTTHDDWRRRRDELGRIIVDIEYGGMPPVPESVTCELLHANKPKKPEGSKFSSWRVIAGPESKFSFIMTTLVPAGKGPFPVVINGDACWRYVTDEVAAMVVERGNALVQFNRVAIAPDIYNSDRCSGLYLVYPDGAYGALSAWAWGYHRCVDALLKMDFVDPDKIAVTGHSRGGKTVLLAGATDERISLTCANNSGAGGAGSYLFQGPESETLADNIRAIPYWYGPKLKEYVGREGDLPFDQHFLKSMIAPRALLTTEALGDLWANPTGTRLTHSAAREAYRFFGAERKIGICYRDGGHAHGKEDWKVFLDFMDIQFRGKEWDSAFDANPFTDLPKAFSWSAPI